MVVRSAVAGEHFAACSTARDLSCSVFKGILDDGGDDLAMVLLIAVRCKTLEIGEGL